MHLPRCEQQCLLPVGGRLTFIIIIIQIENYISAGMRISRVIRRLSAPLRQNCTATPLLAAPVHPRGAAGRWPTLMSTPRTSSAQPWCNGHHQPKRGFFGKARASLLRSSVLTSIRSAQEAGFEGDSGYREALAEIQNGQKKSHWIW